MRKVTAGLTVLLAATALTGCVTVPSGPTIPVMPGRDKSFAEFQADQQFCERYAHDRVAGRVDAENDKIARNTIIGTALGTALGAAIGGDTRGAVAGGAAGAAVGASSAHPGYRQYSAQRQYNIAYAQCMDYRGNDVGGRRGPRHPRWDDRRGDYPPPPPPDDYPPDDE
jgi:hypothetical protein